MQSIRPQPHGIEWVVEWRQVLVLPRAPLKGLAAVAAWAAYRCLMQSWSWQF